MGRVIDCCKGCKNRFVGCHSVCEIYIEQREAYDQDKKAYLDSIKGDLEYGNYMKDIRRLRRIYNFEKKRRER